MPDTKTLPANVLEALQKRGLSDEQIAELTPVEAFSEFCNWHGLHGWSDELWNVMERLQACAKGEEKAVLAVVKGGTLGSRIEWVSDEIMNSTPVGTKLVAQVN